MKPVPSHILILGLAGSGKSTLAKLIGEKLKYDVISLDNYRYRSGWQKRTLEDFKEKTFNAVNGDNNRKVIESTYYDGTDPSQARMKIISEMLPYIEKIFIIDPESLEITISRLIDRSINRALGKEPQGACVESSMNRSKLIIKNVTYYTDNVDHLFKNFLGNEKVIFKTRDKFTEEFA